MERSVIVREFIALADIANRHFRYRTDVRRVRVARVVHIFRMVPAKQIKSLTGSSVGFIVKCRPKRFWQALDIGSLYHGIEPVAHPCDSAFRYIFGCEYSGTDFIGNRLEFG